MVIRQWEKAYCQFNQNPRVLAREKKIAIARERYYYLSDGEVNEYNIRIMRLKFNVINKEKKNKYKSRQLLRRWRPT